MAKIISYFWEFFRPIFLFIFSGKVFSILLINGHSAFFKIIFKFCTTMTTMKNVMCNIKKIFFLESSCICHHAINFRSTGRYIRTNNAVTLNCNCIATLFPINSKNLVIFTLLEYVEHFIAVHQTTIR